MNKRGIKGQLDDMANGIRDLQALLHGVVTRLDAPNYGGIKDNIGVGGSTNTPIEWVGNSGVKAGPDTAVASIDSTGSLWLKPLISDNSYLVLSEGFHIFQYNHHEWLQVIKYETIEPTASLFSKLARHAVGILELRYAYTQGLPRTSMRLIAKTGMGFSATVESEV